MQQYLFLIEHGRRHGRQEGLTVHMGHQPVGMPIFYSEITPIDGITALFKTTSIYLGSGMVVFVVVSGSTLMTLFVCMPYM